MLFAINLDLSLVYSKQKLFVVNIKKNKKSNLCIFNGKPTSTLSSWEQTQQQQKLTDTHMIKDMYSCLTCAV